MRKTLLKDSAKVDRSSPYSILGLKERASKRKVEKALRQAGLNTLGVTDDSLLNDPDNRLFLQAVITLQYPALLDAYHQHGTFDDAGLRVWLASKAIRDSAKVTSASPAPVHAVVTIRHAKSQDGPFGEEETVLDEPCLLLATDHRVFLAPLTSAWDRIPRDVWKQSHSHSTASRRNADSGLHITAQGRSVDGSGYAITSLTTNDVIEGERRYRIPGMTSSTASMIDELEQRTREALLDHALAENHNGSSLDIARATIESLGYRRDEPPLHASTLVHIYQGALSDQRTVSQYLSRSLVCADHEWFYMCRTDKTPQVTPEAWARISLEDLKSASVWSDESVHLRFLPQNASESWKLILGPALAPSTAQALAALGAALEQAANRDHG